MDKDSIIKLVEKSLNQRPELFIIEVKVNQNNQIRVVLDGDRPISVNDCMEVSREIEQELDREEEDFSLEVTSVGVTSPLQFPRQFKKNKGRKLKVKTATETYKAELTQADEEGINLTWKQREAKTVGKGKHTVEKNVRLKYSEIIQAKVMITFN